MNCSNQSVAIPMSGCPPLESQQVASEIWPKDNVGEDASDDEEVAGLSLEQQIANEVSAIKSSRTENPEHRFGKVCLIFQRLTLIASCSFSQLSNKYPMRWVVGIRAFLSRI